MASLKAVLGVTHAPFLPAALGAPLNEDGDPGFARTKALFDDFRVRLQELNPDVLLVVGADHLSQWFSDNMPAFLIGKARHAKGTFWHETDEFGVPEYDVDIDHQLASQLIEGVYERGVDVSFSDELTLDHSFTVPLHFLAPDKGIPVVPVHTNVMAPPLPTAERFFQVGRSIASAVNDADRDARVVAVVSGHLSVEVGGPRMHQIVSGQGPPDPEFDERMTELMAAGDVDRLISESTLERLTRAGHVGGTGFLTYLTALGLADGKRPDFAEKVDTGVAAFPFFQWGCK